MPFDPWTAYNNVPLLRDAGSGAYTYTTDQMALDADGSLFAYHPDNTGRDDLGFASWPSGNEDWRWILVADPAAPTRPWIQPQAGGGYEMNYSVRRKSLRAYRLGYAVSPDGLAWTRMDASVGLDVTAGSFDSDAIMYAAPIRVGDGSYCYYNGNDFGREGFAVAVRQDAG